MISASDIASEERSAWISSMKINDLSVRYRFRRAVGMEFLIARGQRQFRVRFLGPSPRTYPSTTQYFGFPPSFLIRRHRRPFRVSFASPQPANLPLDNSIFGFPLSFLIARCQRPFMVRFLGPSPRTYPSTTQYSVFLPHF